MVMEVGKFEPTASEILTTFGLRYEKLRQNEKRFLWQIYVQRTELTFFDSRI